MVVDIVVVVGDTGLIGLGLTRTVLAPVQASRRASKQASPGFQEASSLTARLLLARLASSELLTAGPTASGLSKRKGEEVLAEAGSVSLSERSEVHSARGR